MSDSALASKEVVENTTQTTSTTSNTAETISSVVDLPAALLGSELEQASHYYQVSLDFLTRYSFQLVGGLLILLVGFVLSNKISNAVLKLCKRKEIDITLSLFIASTTKIIMLIMVAVVVLSKIGISITPFIAGIGAVSLGAALALQGLLANYASGLNIIITRPFVVDDTIEILGVSGIVKEVKLAFTIIQDEEDALITIPNKHIVGEVLLNSKKDRLLKLSVGISYQSNPIEVIKIIETTLAKLDIYSDKTKMQVGIDEFADSAISIGIRLWIPTNNLYSVKYKAYEAIYLAFETHQINIPYPQQEVRILQDGKS